MAGARPAGGGRRRPCRRARRAPAGRSLHYLWRRFRRNRLALAALAFLVGVHAVAVLAPTLAPHDPEAIDLLNQFALPSGPHLLGTDETGRVVLSRVLYGARTSPAVALLSMVVAISVGTVLGAVSGFYGRLADALIMRLTDGMLTVPTFFLALLILAVFGSNLLNVVLVIGLTGWMVVARVVRAEVLRTMPLEFVLASRALGASEARTPACHLCRRRCPP